MKLTERQRWDILRDMIKTKNIELRRFLFVGLDIKNMSAYRTFLSKVRDNFLGDFNINFKDLSETYKCSNNWLNAFSCEDLLMFYDYQCRLLQNLYYHGQTYCYLGKKNEWNFSNNMPLSYNNIYEICNKNQCGYYATYKGSKERLDLTGRPKINKKDIDVNIQNKKELAISETMINLHRKYADRHNIDANINAKTLASRFKTYTQLQQVVFGVQSYNTTLINMLEERLIDRQISKNEVQENAEQLQIFSTFCDQEFSDAVIDYNRENNNANFDT